MGHAADFGDAQLEACLVAGEVVTDQLAVGQFSISANTPDTPRASLMGIETKGGCSPGRLSLAIRGLVKNLLCWVSGSTIPVIEKCHQHRLSSDAVEGIGQDYFPG